MGEETGTPTLLRAGVEVRAQGSSLGSPLAPVSTCAPRWAGGGGTPALLRGDGGGNLPCGAPSRWCPMWGTKLRSPLCWFSEPRGPWVPPGTDRRPLGKPLSIPPALSWGLVGTGLPSYPASLFLPRAPSLYALLPTRRGEHGGRPGREHRGALAQTHRTGPLCLVPRGLVEDSGVAGC